MSSDTSSALHPPTMTAPTPKPPRAKVMRIATMTKQLLDEVRTQTLDTAGLNRLRTIDTQIIGELLTDLTPDLREELQRLALPLARHTELSDAELRLAHAHTRGLASRAPPHSPDCPDCLTRSTHRRGDRLDHRPSRRRHLHAQRHPHLTEPPRSTARRTVHLNEPPTG